MISRFFAGAALVSGAGVAASAFVPQLRPLAWPLRIASATLMGAAHKSRADENATLESRLKLLLNENSVSVFRDGLHFKPVERLSIRDTIRLTLLNDSDMDRLSPALQVEVLKAQILLEMHRAPRKGTDTSAEFLFKGHQADTLSSPEGISILRKGRDSIRQTLGSSDAKTKGWGSLFGIGGTEIAEAVAKRYIRAGAVTKLFAAAESVQVIRDSAGILLSRLPAVRTLEELIESERKRLLEARERFGVAHKAQLLHFPAITHKP